MKNFLKKIPKLSFSQLYKKRAFALSIASGICVLILIAFIFIGLFDTKDQGYYQAYLDDIEKTYNVPEAVPKENPEKQLEENNVEPKEDSYHIAEENHDEDSLSQISVGHIAEEEGDKPDNGDVSQDDVESENKTYTGQLVIPEQPSVAIVVPTLGLSLSHTQKIIYQLPGEVTLSFSPYTKDLELFIKEASEHGHEVIMDLPLEAFNHHVNEPGPYTLYTAYSPEKLQKLLEKMIISKKVIGLYAYQGEKFLEDENALNTLFHLVKDRHLFFINSPFDSKELSWKVARELKVGYIRPSLIIDNPPTRQSIRRKLIQAEQAAEKKGFSCIIMQGSPLALQLIREWVERLPHKNIKLMRVSEFFQP